MSRYRDPHLQVAENHPNLFNLSSNMCKSWCLDTHFIPNYSDSVYQWDRIVVVFYTSLLFVSSVLRAGLLHLRNHLILVGRLDPDSLQTLSDILQQYVLCWQRAEEDKRRREEEKAALYKYKATSHGDERSEDQQDADAIKQAFPSYQEVRLIRFTFADWRRLKAFANQRA